MSSYMFMARKKSGGDVVKVFAIDDYFGRHKYGYEIPGGMVLTEHYFHRHYDEVKDRDLNEIKEQTK